MLRKQKILFESDQVPLILGLIVSPLLIHKLGPFLHFLSNHSSYFLSNFYAPSIVLSILSVSLPSKNLMN